MSPAAVRLKVQALEPLLARCHDASFTAALLNQEKQIDSADFKKELVQIVGIGSSATQISFLLDLVLAHGPLATAACQQLAILFPSTSHATQLHIAKLLTNQLESGPSVFSIMKFAYLRVWLKWHRLRSLPLLFPRQLFYRYWTM